MLFGSMHISNLIDMDLWFYAKGCLLRALWFEARCVFKFANRMIRKQLMIFTK